MSRVIHISSNEELDKHLKDPRVVIDFSAEWCKFLLIEENIMNFFILILPCRFISPVFEKLSNEFTTYTFLHVDIDKVNGHPLVKTIGSVPHFEFFVNGTKVSEFSGASEHDLRASLDANK
ncbi:hypothetical protein ACTFIY_006318 [Dictyostelium cf. discoideum]